MGTLENGVFSVSRHDSTANDELRLRRPDREEQNPGVPKTADTEDKKRGRRGGTSGHKATAYCPVPKTQR